MKKLVKENAHRLGLYYKYLRSLHDSWFIGTKITANKLTIKLNDFTTHVFSDVIVDKKKLDIDHEKRVFPILIEFEVTNLTFNTVDENGEIQKIRNTYADYYKYFKAQLATGRYLSDQSLCYDLCEEYEQQTFTKRTTLRN